MIIVTVTWARRQPPSEPGCQRPGGLRPPRARSRFDSEWSRRPWQCIAGPRHCASLSYTVPWSQSRCAWGSRRCRGTDSGAAGPGRVTSPLKSEKYPGRATDFESGLGQAVLTWLPDRCPRYTNANLRYQEALDCRAQLYKRRMQLPSFVRAVLIELSVIQRSNLSTLGRQA